MTKVALKTIAIISATANNPAAVEYFTTFNQADATLTEKGENDATGIAYTQEINYIVRRTNDITLAQKYQRRAAILHVYTVDGHHYIIGSQQDPVFLDTNNQYDGTKVREMQITVKTQSLFPLF